MSSSSLDSFFSGGGGRSVSWRDQPIGATVHGTIEAVHPPQQATDPKDGSPKFKRNGDPVMQVRIDLATGFRNWEMCKRPDDISEGDDGRRSLYVGGWMTGAVGDALKKAGRHGPPEVGGELAVKLVERTPNADNPVLNPTNKFAAEYSSPSAAATGQFFGANGASDPKKPAAISDAAWAAMDAATRATVANTMSVGADEPPF